MTSPGGPEGTTETLDRARAELARQLGDACEHASEGELPETTGELLRLEDSLLAAARATEHMIALRRKARGDREVGTGEDRIAGDSLEGIREFHDRHGVEWRVWSVIPGRASSKAQRYLGELRSGWLAFETLDGGARRRLAPFPPNWIAASDEELQRLLDQAAEAPVRRKSIEEDRRPPEA